MTPIVTMPTWIAWSRRRRRSSLTPWEAPKGLNSISTRARPPKSEDHSVPRAQELTEMGQGRVVSIHIAPGAADAMSTVEHVRAVAAKGLEGDRYFLALGTFWKPKPDYE